VNLVWKNKLKITGTNKKLPTCDKIILLFKLCCSCIYVIFLYLLTNTTNIADTIYAITTITIDTTNDKYNVDVLPIFANANSKLDFCKKYKPAQVPHKNINVIIIIRIFFFNIA
jgi:hypothetical protein